MQSFTLSEWEEIGVAQLDISQNAVDQLVALAERERRRLRVAQNILTKTVKPGLKAGPVVGVLSVPGVSIEILPKIQGQHDNIREVLSRMIAVAFRLPILDSNLASMSTQNRDLLEVFVRIFVHRLNEATRRGLPHRYRSIEEDLTLLRGKLNVSRQMLLHFSRADRLACIFDELSVDTPLNRVLKAAVMMLLRVAHESSNQRILTELAARLDLVADSANPLREPVVLDRTNASFHRIHALARLLLSGKWQNTSAGSHEGVALLFEMNYLFESFVGRSLQKALDSRRVKLQRSDKHALQYRDRGLFTLKPDFVIDESTVVDTKWKELNADDPLLGVSSSDVYQMLAYSQAYEAKRLVLLYPWHDRLGDPGIHRTWQVSGTDIIFDIATIDLSKPDDVPPALHALVGVAS